MNSITRLALVYISEATSMTSEAVTERNGFATKRMPVASDADEREMEAMNSLFSFAEQLRLEQSAKLTEDTIIS